LLQNRRNSKKLSTFSGSASFCSIGSGSTRCWLLFGRSEHTRIAGVVGNRDGIRLMKNLLTYEEALFEAKPQRPAARFFASRQDTYRFPRIELKDNRKLCRCGRGPGATGEMGIERRDFRREVNMSVCLLVLPDFRETQHIHRNESDTLFC
jgi:hypothetical protein